MRGTETKFTTLTVVIPVFNEVDYIATVLGRVRQVVIPGVELEVVVVDDCSSDGTREVLAALSGKDLRIFLQERHQGNGQRCAGGFPRPAATW